MYVRLNPNHKTLYYGDWNESSAVPSFDNLPNKTAVADIKDFIVGADTLNQLQGGREVRRNRANDNTTNLSMSILVRTLNLIVKQFY